MTEDIVKTIINHCPLTSIHQYFIEDKNTRQKFEKILRKCKTYRTYRREGGRDRKQIKKQFEATLYEALKF